MFSPSPLIRLDTSGCSKPRPTMIPRWRDSRRTSSITFGHTDLRGKNKESTSVSFSHCSCMQDVFLGIYFLLLAPASVSDDSPLYLSSAPRDRYSLYVYISTRSTYNTYLYINSRGEDLGQISGVDVDSDSPQQFIQPRKSH